MSLHAVQDSVDRICDLILGYALTHSKKILRLLDHLLVLTLIFLTKLRAEQDDELGRIETVVLFRASLL